MVNAETAWKLAEKLVCREGEAFSLKDSPSDSPTDLTSTLRYDCSYAEMHRALDLAEDLAEDAIEHHKNELARLQSTLKRLRSFRADNKIVTKLLNG
jgi:hypothetical protein